jgi:hypothetical protein
MMEKNFQTSVIILGLLAICLIIYDQSKPRNPISSSQYYEIVGESATNNPRRLQATAPNYAPQVQVNANLCSKPRLWGRAHQGGWEICEDVTYFPYSAQDCLDCPRCIVYSYGLGADWSFDNSAEASGCEVHGFDPTGKLWRDGMHGVDYSRIDYARQYPSSMKHFHNYGLGAASRVVYPVASGMPP